MPDTYRQHDGDEAKTLTRTCSETSGCGDEIEVMVEPDGSYEGGHFFGEIDVPAEGAELVGEHSYEDEWYGRMTEGEWSDYETKEFWLHEGCAQAEDYDPDEVEHSVA